GRFRRGRTGSYLKSNCGLTPLVPGQRDAGSTRTSTRKTWVGASERKTRGYPGRRSAGVNLVAVTTLTDILANVVGGRVAVSRQDGKAGQDVLRRVGEASVLILISLADGPKHGYALIQDIKQLADVELGPGTLYGALDRLEGARLVWPRPPAARS